MPRLIPCEDEESIELGDLIEALETGGFDPEDEESITSFGPALGRLGNNRRFLGDLLVEELKQRCAGQIARSQYGPQVAVLHRGAAKYLLRANFWPAAGDSVVVNSGISPFFYGVAHDHNFSFLTVGYHGPGYWSDYYEYEYESVAGYSGEAVDLRFVERSRLSPGKVLLYRKHRDVHLQLPPEALSVSLNILALSPATEFRDQYQFDVDRGQVHSVVNPSSLEALIMLASHCGGDNGRDLLAGFAAGHPSERIRFSAIKAQAAVAGDVDARIAVYETAARLPDRFVREMARQEARRIEACRAWIEDPAQVPA